MRYNLWPVIDRDGVVHGTRVEMTYEQLESWFARNNSQLSIHGGNRRYSLVARGTPVTCVLCIAEGRLP